MDRYLVDFDQAFNLDQSVKEKDTIMRFMEGKDQRLQKKEEIKDIKVWTDIVGSVEKSQWLQAQTVHMDKLNDYRNTKKW